MIVFYLELRAIAQNAADFFMLRGVNLPYYIRTGIPVEMVFWLYKERDEKVFLLIAMTFREQIRKGNAVGDSMNGWSFNN